MEHRKDAEERLRRIIAERFRECRTKTGLSLTDAAKELSRAMGETVSPSRLGNWESPLDPKAPVLYAYPAIAKFYGVNPAWLAGLDDRRTNDANENGFIPLRSPRPAGDTPIRIDLQDKSIALHADFIEALGLNRNSAVIVTAPDNTMSNILRKGDRAIIDTRQKHPAGADVFGLMIDGQPWIRWIRKELDGTFIIAEDGAGSAKETSLSAEGLNEIQIIGRVSVVVSRR